MFVAKGWSAIARTIEGCFADKNRLQERERESIKDTLPLTAHIITALLQSEWKQQMPG